MSEKASWLTQEEISGLFEKALNPAATVNINTPRDRPDITGASRQLDVEVLVGNEPRRIRSIVEVQKRKQKVGLATYEGWIEKKRKLNAALLICVSEKGFSKQVVDAARSLNPFDVKLGLLQQVSAEVVHPHFVSRFVAFSEINTNTLYTSDFELITANNKKIRVSGSKASSTPIFDQLSLHDLFVRQLQWQAIETETLVSIDMSEVMPELQHTSWSARPKIKAVSVKLKHEVTHREVFPRYFLYKQVFPEEELIGACALADKVSMQNVRGNLALIMLPHPEGMNVLPSFKTLGEDIDY